MISTIETDAKRQFIAHFLQRYPHQPKEWIWLWNYLLTPVVSLDHIHFTLKHDVYDHTLVIDPVQETFRYRKGTVETDDVERVFHAIRLLEDAPLYIECRFPNRARNMYYAAVYEEIEYELQCEKRRADNARVSSQIVRKMECEWNERRLLEQIDDSLDRGDVEQFQRLHAQLLRLQGGNGK